jgi:hypothetical protein
LSPFYDAWVEQYGGKPSAGQLAKAMKPLLEEHDEAETLARWRYYLKQTEASYASPQRFASTFGQWIPEAEPKSAFGFSDDDFD